MRSIRTARMPARSPRRSTRITASAPAVPAREIVAAARCADLRALAALHVRGADLDASYRN